MARPSTLTAEQEARIASSPLPPGVLLRQLQTEGWGGSLRTIQRARARHKGAGVASSPGAATSAMRAALAARAERDTASELAPDDDLGRLARRRDQIDAALTEWEPRLKLEPKAVNAYRALSAELTSLTRTLVELRPRPEVEAERLEALGVAARVRLLERAGAAADADELAALRQRCADQECALETLRNVLAEG